jgi:ribonuclease R
MSDLMDLLFSFGYHIKGDPADIKPIELQKMLAGIAGRPEEDLIRRLSLRSMKQARYENECMGHFGLAVKEYTHFTSPIRRYPDLQIHRILKKELKGELDKKEQDHFKNILPRVAKHCSARERRAVDAEREIDKVKMAEYMESRIGGEYDGMISGVTAWGMYVELNNTVEGMVPVSKIAGDDYDYVSDEYAIVGRYTGRKFYLGQNIRVRVASVDLMLHTIDFELADQDVYHGTGGGLEKRTSGKKRGKKSAAKKDKNRFKQTKKGKKKGSSGNKGKYGVID